MQLYMDCLEKNSGNSTQCRELSKDYLQCRMNKYVLSFSPTPIFVGFLAKLDLDGSFFVKKKKKKSGLMEKDEWKNLGLANLDRNKTAAAAPLPATSGMPEGKKSNSPPDSPTATL